MRRTCSEVCRQFQMRAHLVGGFDVADFQDLLSRNNAPLFHILAEAGQFRNALLQLLRRDKGAASMLAVEKPLADQQVDRLADRRPADGIQAFQLALGWDGLVRLEFAIRDALAQDICQLVIARQKIVGIDHFRHAFPFPKAPSNHVVMTSWIIVLFPVAVKTPSLKFLSS